MRLPGAPPAALVFDLDGTLIDSRRDLATAVNRLRREMGMPPLPVEQVVAMVGEGARLLVERALGPDFPPERFEAAFATYRGFYMEACLDETRAYPGVPELLAALAPRYPLAVLTNKTEGVSRKILEGLGLAGYFREIAGGDTFPVRKPDPAGVVHLAAVLGVPVAEILLVGDSRFDAETAQNAGCRFALVEWGFPPPEERAGIAADLRVGEARDLALALDAPLAGNVDA